ncbi:MAG: glyceraldehyde 3-phosphate dehydrogenase N-terminal domain-containing protein, partial [Candidatus Tenebribacter mawsonii]|nr:glyceraldehyde 3-phosphate dehydrogenase N-terminal domain-containing protein [Candidatus Tenebribacter mawsonii]
MKNIAINGFGRIGRLVFRGFLNNDKYKVVAINDLMDMKSLVYLLKHDSVHGILKNTIEVKEGAIVVDGVEVKVFSERNPEELPWKELDINVVVESTGIFRSKEGAAKHLTAGAK